MIGAWEETKNKIRVCENKRNGGEYDMEVNDKEIVQTLINHIEAEDCVTCESFGKCNEFLLTKNTLDLINRQQAKIEQLTGNLNFVRGTVERQLSEIDRLTAENMLTMSEKNAFRTSFYEVSKQLKTAKSEAVKEFCNKRGIEYVENNV